MCSYIAASVVGLLTAAVPGAVSDVRVNYCAWRSHLASNSAFEPVVKRLTVQTVPQLRTAALVAPGAVDAGASVMAGG